MRYAKLAVQFLVYIAQITRAQGFVKVSQYITVYREKFLLVLFSIFKLH